MSFFPLVFLRCSLHIIGVHFYLLTELDSETYINNLKRGRMSIYTKHKACFDFFFFSFFIIIN
jgi:hypothetical protein